MPKGPGQQDAPHLGTQEGHGPAGVLGGLDDLFEDGLGLYRISAEDGL